MAIATNNALFNIRIDVADGILHDKMSLIVFTSIYYIHHIIKVILIVKTIDYIVVESKSVGYYASFKCPGNVDDLLKYADLYEQE